MAYAKVKDSSFQQQQKNHLDLFDDCDIYNALNLKAYRTDCGNSY